MLLLFMVSTTKPEIQLQPIQQPTIELPITPQIGRTERPLNQRTQVTNVYLDSTQFNGSATIASMTLSDWANLTQTKISWNYVWKMATSPAKLYIPTGWTYMIQWRVFISSALSVWLLSTFFQKNWTASLELFAWLSNHWTTIPIIFTANFVKWDYINIYTDNSSGNSVDISYQLVITKIS